MFLKMLKKRKMILIRNKKGFSLIETMIALVFLVSAITAALKVYLDISFLMAESRQKINAIFQLSCLFEEFRSRGSALPTSNLLNTDWVTWIENNSQIQILPQEAVALLVEDMFPGDQGSPRVVTVTLSYVGARGHQRGLTLRGAVL